MLFLNHRHKGNRFVHSMKHLRTNCEPNAICFSQLFLFAAFAVGFLFYFSESQCRKKKLQEHYFGKQTWTYAECTLEHWIRLWFVIPKVSERGIGAASWSQLLMVLCFLLVGNRWRGLCPVGATLLGGWCFHNEFTIRGTGTHKHTHGTLGMESYHFHWVQEVKSACIEIKWVFTRNSIALIMFTVLNT